MAVVTIPYKPRSTFCAFHERNERWAVLVVHRRGGKTVAVINDLIKRALECSKPHGRFAYIAPTYTQAKDVAWAYLKRFSAVLPGLAVSESELHVTLPNGARIRLYGADNYERLRGIYLDGCVIDESADMAPQAWSEILRPALADREGWCVWIGTPKGRDSFYKLWRDAADDANWFSMFLPASKSGLLPADELADALKQMISIQGPIRGRAAYDQEFECSFDSPSPGAIYAASVTAARAAGRINNEVLHYAQLPVYSAFDIGAPFNTKCWIFQVNGDRINLLECLTGDDECATPAHWVKRLKDKTAYNWGGHFLPHDGETMWLRAMQDAGLRGVVVLPRSINIWDNINDTIAAFPRCAFAATGCAEGIEALEAYRSKEEADGMTIRNVPIHDWASHASTAFGYVHQAIKLGMLVDRSGMPHAPMQRRTQPIALPRRVHAGGRF